METTLNPDERENRFHRAAVLLELGRPKEAATLIGREVARSPEDAEAWQWLSSIYTKLGQFVEALNAAQQAVRLAPEDSQNFVQLGVALWNTGVRGRRHWSMKGAAAPAIQALAQALRLDTDNDQARLLLADFHLSLGKPVEAKPLLERVLHSSPGNLAARLGLAKVALAAKEYAQAERLLKGVLASAPLLVEAQQLLAQIKLQQGLAEEAFTLALDAIRLDPTNTAAHQQLKTLTDNWFPAPFGFGSPAWRFVLLPHAVVLIPFIGLFVWIRNGYRMAQLPPKLRHKIRVFRRSSLPKWHHWRLGLIWACVITFLMLMLTGKEGPLYAFERPINFLFSLFYGVAFLWILWSIGIRLYIWIRSLVKRR